MKYNVELWIQEWGNERNWGAAPADKIRELAYSYSYESPQSNTEGVAEEAFVATNAPEGYIEDYLKFIREKYHGASVSVGDIVKVNDDQWLCKGCGWQKL